VATLFPYKLDADVRLVHVDLGFFRDLGLAPDDLVRIEVTQEGIELTPIQGGDFKHRGGPYRIRLADGYEQKRPFPSPMMSGKWK
jgi:hypothetical protein